MESSPAGVTDDDVSGSLAWYALYVKPNTEHRVHHHLTAKSIPTFLPLIETIRSGPARRIAALEPLFPGYLFVHLDSVERDPTCWRAVRWAPGVRSILGTDETPIAVPHEAVEAIQERVKPHGFVRLGIPFQPRSPVRFQSGPLAGLEAIFERPLSRWGRARVLMTLLGRKTGVEVDVLDLERV